MKRLKNKRVFLYAALFLLFFMKNIGGAASCLSIGNELTLNIPCVQYQGISYNISVKYFSNPRDASSIYWKTESVSIASSQDNQCLPISDELRYYVPCVEYGGARFRLVSEYYKNPDDPFGLYWKIPSDALFALPEQSPSGTGILTIGDESYNTSIVYYCPQALNENPGILVYLHGDGESNPYVLMTRLEQDFKAIADEKGLVVIAVVANNLGFRMVDSTGHYMTDDYYNTIDAIRLSYKTWAVNPYKTYLTGYSAGGPGAVMMSRSEIRQNIRAANLWCGPYNAYALIPNDYSTQVPIRVVSNSGDGNYYSSFQQFGAMGNGSFGYWQIFLKKARHQIEVVDDTHIYGHQFDSQSVREACEWMLKK
jgi:hypothetical protein